MTINRPDLTNLEPEIRIYIESLEAEIKDLTTRLTKTIDKKSTSHQEPIGGEGKKLHILDLIFP